MMALVHSQRLTDELPADLSLHSWDICGNNSKVELTEEALPIGFPQRVTTNLAWRGSDFHEEEMYTHYLTDRDKLEIHAALVHFKGCGLDGDLVTCDNFPLPQLQHNLRALSIELHTGRGFFVLRGLHPMDYSVEDGMIVFLGIQAYVASQRARQDVEGNMIVHITPETSPSDPLRSCHVRHSNSSIALHTDSNADILAFQTRCSARRGGNCVLSSSYSIYNELATTRPDVIRALAQSNWPFALPYFHTRPILFYHSSRMILNFNRPALLGSTAHPRPSTVPSLTPLQAEALETLDRVAEAQHLELKTKPGDLHFVNNLALLHRRSGFVDADDEGTIGNPAKRHLVRMHLRNKDLAWDIPPALKGDWDKAFEDEDTGGDCKWHIMPMPPGFFPLRVDCN